MLAVTVRLYGGRIDAMSALQVYRHFLSNIWMWGNLVYAGHLQVPKQLG